MIKHKKMITAFVIFAFLSLLQISAMPQAAQQSPDQAGTSISNPDEAPNFIEEEGDAGYQPKKKSMLPIILGVVALGAVVAVLVLVVLKTKYDITGQWQVSWNYPGYNSGSAPIIFSGDKKSGSFAIGSSSGTYTVDGKNVSWTYSDGNTVYTGTFSGKNNMSGTIVSSGTPGTWTAVRQAATTGFGNIAATKGTGEREL